MVNTRSIFYNIKEFHFDLTAYITFRVTLTVNTKYCQTQPLHINLYNRNSEFLSGSKATFRCWWIKGEDLDFPFIVFFRNTPDGLLNTKANSRGRMVNGVGLRTLAYWDCGIEPRRGHGSVRQRSLSRADHSSGGILPSVLCLKCVREASIMRGAPR